MKKLSMILAGSAFLAIAPVAVHAEGKTAFENAKCTKCHSVKVWGLEAKKTNKAPDLSKVGAELDAATIEAFVSKKSEKKSTWGKKKGKQVKHKKKYTKPDLKEIAEALSALK